MIAIIGAMEEEVAVLKEMMESADTLTRASMTFYHGVLQGQETVIVQSGIGKVNAAICTQILADAFHPEVIINTGIAGSLDGRINIGDIVVSTDAVQHDVDTSVFGERLGQIPGMDIYAFPADEGLRRIAIEANKQVNPEVRAFEGRVVSGDQFISKKETKLHLINEFQGMCSEMEGAAIAQAAYLNQIPYLIIRAISDKADDSALIDYPAFKQQAITHSVQLVLKILQNI